MNKKVIVFLLVLVGLGGFVWWQTSAPQSAQDRLAKAMSIMQGLESRAIPVALTGDQIKLLEQVYQDSLERIPNIQGFRDTDRTKLISALQSAGLTGTGTNGLSATAEQLVTLSSEKTDVFASKINGYMTNLGTTVSGTVATNIKKLAQSVNTLTNDIRITKLFVAWYENIRGKICTTNDPNNDIYISGEVKMVYTPNTSLQDSCRSDGAEVKQYKCINGLYEDDAAHVSKTQCPNGCSGSVCLRENMSDKISISAPELAYVSTPTSIKVTTGKNYTQPFFIIVEGDDDAEFPTGALRMMSGEVYNDMLVKKFEIKFSKPGKVIVTIRPKEGMEDSKVIEVREGSPGAGWYGSNCNACINGRQSCAMVCFENNKVVSDSRCTTPKPSSDQECNNNMICVLDPAICTTKRTGNVWECYDGATKIDAECRSLQDGQNSGIEFCKGHCSPESGLCGLQGQKPGETLCGDTGGGGGYTVSCSSVTGASVTGCSECKRINLASSSMAQSIFVPRNGIPTGSKEYVVSGQATITAQTYQGAQVTPTGNIKNVFDIFESAPTNAPWQWTRMKGGTLVLKGNTQPTSIISNNPIYSIRYTIPSVLKNAAGTTLGGTSVTATQCHFYYNTPTTTSVENCTDSDGADYFIKGVVKSAGFDPAYDSCDDKDTLSERVCRPYRWQEGTGSCSRPDGCIDIIKYKCANGCNDGACIADATVISCTGTRPANSTILANAGTASQAWSHDGSPTGPYQNCTFKCQAGYNYINNACVQSTAGLFNPSRAQENFNTINSILAPYLAQPGNINVAAGEFGGAATQFQITQDTQMTPFFNSFTKEEAWDRVKAILKISTSVPVLWSTSSVKYENDSIGDNERYFYSYVIQQSSDVQKQISFATEYLPGYGWRKVYLIGKDFSLSICPTYTTPACIDGTLTDGGKDANGCSKAQVCVKNITCPQYTSPPADFCKGGQIIDGGTDANGCIKAPTCTAKLITGPVTVDGVKDCWFGDATKKITLGELASYQANPGTNSGIKYLDEILLYGAAAPTANESLTNIFSYEEGAWTSANNTAVTSATSLSNFFAFRVNSSGTRTWNIPTNAKFYGCFARGDRPTTW